MLADMSLPPEEFLLSVINNTYGKNYTFDDVIFGERTDTTLYGCESKIYLIANPAGKLTGRWAVYYNRVPLDEFLVESPIVAERNTFKDTDDLLPLVPIQLGINIRRSDIISDIITDDPMSVNIRISNRCLAYKGSIPVYVSGHPNSLGVRVNQRTLNGFNKPI